jgi:hypothetical protein
LTPNKKDWLSVFNAILAKEGGGDLDMLPATTKSNENRDENPLFDRSFRALP